MAQCREVHLHRCLGRLPEAAHVAQYALDMLEHVARTHAQQLALATRCSVAFVGPFVERVDPLLHRRALVFAGVLQQMQRVARFEQQAPVGKAARGFEQFMLQVAELPREQAAQVEVAVDDVIDHAQHELGRAGGHARAAAGVVACAHGEQPLREVVAHRAVRRMHADQHAVEHHEAHRAGVDGRQRATRRVRRAVLFVDEEVLAAQPRSQPPHHQHVVPRGVVEVTGQLCVQQVRDMQVDELTAHPALQRRLHVDDGGLELAARAAQPQEAIGRQLLRPGVELGEALGRDVKEPHQASRKRRAASSAK